jgi:squalene synthase HpnC
MRQAAPYFMAYFAIMNFTQNTLNVTQSSMQQAREHYENFPVASMLLPKRLRAPIALIYSFARQADDFADEGDLSIEQRLQLLQEFRDELDLIQAYIQPKTALFIALKDTIKQYKLPINAFYDLLDAFSQDVTKTRYANFDEVLDYCRRSANPIGTLLLHLYGQATPANLKHSDNICSALQLINFYQDVAIDFAKNDGKRRIYLCADEMQQFGITEEHISAQKVDGNWQKLMLFNINRAEAMLHAGKPLGRILTGRIGLEMRLIIAGGQTIIDKLKASNGDIFNRRPKLNKLDWLKMLSKAVIYQ